METFLNLWIEKRKNENCVARDIFELNLIRLHDLKFNFLNVEWTLNLKRQ